jgi:hypothetical protein
MTFRRRLEFAWCVVAQISDLVGSRFLVVVVAATLFGFARVVACVTLVMLAVAAFAAVRVNLESVCFSRYEIYITEEYREYVDAASERISRRS